MQSVFLEFGGVDRSFLVQIGELRKIQTACAASPAKIARELARGVATLRAFPKAGMLRQLEVGIGDWEPEWVRQPILVGLVAGGNAPSDAQAWVRQEIDERGFIGLVDNLTLALTLIIAGAAKPAEAGREGKEGSGEPRPPPKPRRQKTSS